MKIERVWAMPNKKTFTIKPIKELLLEEGYDETWIDPFPFPYQKDALDYLKTFDNETIDNLVFDPPYSPGQLKECYHGLGKAFGQKDAQSYWRWCRDEISRIIKPGGKVIWFGWHSNAVGKKRGFEISRMLIVAHGKEHNDTICTVEVKKQSRLEFS